MNICDKCNKTSLLSSLSELRVCNDCWWDVMNHKGPVKLDTSTMYYSYRLARGGVSLVLRTAEWGAIDPILETLDWEDVERYVSEGVTEIYLCDY